MFEKLQKASDSTEDVMCSVLPMELMVKDTVFFSSHPGIKWTKGEWREQGEKGTTYSNNFTL